MGQRIQLHNLYPVPSPPPHTNQNPLPTVALRAQPAIDKEAGVSTHLLLTILSETLVWVVLALAPAALESRLLEAMGLVIIILLDWNELAVRRDRCPGVSRKL
jgi:hypothetical protein